MKLLIVSVLPIADIKMGYLRMLKGLIVKDQFGIAPLKIDDVCVNDSKDKVEFLNNQFQSVFTSENIIHMPDCNGSPSPTIYA